MDIRAFSRPKNMFFVSSSLNFLSRSATRPSPCFSYRRFVGLSKTVCSSHPVWFTSRFLCFGRSVKWCPVQRWLVFLFGRASPTSDLKPSLFVAMFFDWSNTGCSPPPDWLIAQFSLCSCRSVYQYPVRRLSAFVVYPASQTSDLKPSRFGAVFFGQPKTERPPHPSWFSSRFSWLLVFFFHPASQTSDITPSLFVAAICRIKKCPRGLSASQLFLFVGHVAVFSRYLAPVGDCGSYDSMFPSEGGTICPIWASPLGDSTLPLSRPLLFAGFQRV